MERRAHHRYTIALPIEVRFEAAGRGIAARALSVEISRGAMTLSCDDGLIGALLGQDAYPRTCTLAFSAPDAEGRFEVDCRVVRHRRLSQHRYHLMLVFNHFTLGDEDVLARCLEDHAPGSVKSARVSFRSN